MTGAALYAAARMDRIYARQTRIYDLTRRPYLLGRAALVDGLAPPRAGHVLEIGCGTAWNLLRAARAFPDARLYGLDVSSVMLTAARRSVARQGLTGRVSLAQADATAFRAQALFGQAHFDRVLISYALSMIPGWARVIAGSLRALAPQGELHIIDFGPCDRLPAVARAGLHAWLARFSVTPIADFGPQVERIAADWGCGTAIDHPYRGYAVRALATRAA